MKKIILALVAVLGFSVFANAQYIKASFFDNKNDPERSQFVTIDFNKDGTCLMKTLSTIFNGLYVIDNFEDYPDMKPGKAYRFVMVWIDEDMNPRPVVGQVVPDEEGMLDLTFGNDKYRQWKEDE